MTPSRGGRAISGRYSVIIRSASSHDSSAWEPLVLAALIGVPAGAHVVRRRTRRRLLHDHGTDRPPLP